MYKLILTIMGLLFVLGITKLSAGEIEHTSIVIQKLHASDRVRGTDGTKKHKVIRTHKRYSEELYSYGDDDDPADIDFSKYTVLLVDMGKISSGDYSLFVGETVTSTEEYLKITIRYVSCYIRSQAVTNPYWFFSIPTRKYLLIQEEWIVERKEDSFC